MKGIRDITEKELAGLTTPAYEIKYKTQERRIPTQCPNCGSKTAGKFCENCGLCISCA